MTTDRLHLLLSVELDRAVLEAYRAELEEKGSLDLYPGEPDEWTSILDVVDLVDREIIVRSELLEVVEGPPPWKPAHDELSVFARCLARIYRRAS